MIIKVEEKLGSALSFSYFVCNSLGTLVGDCERWFEGIWQEA